MSPFKEPSSKIKIREEICIARETTINESKYIIHEGKREREREKDEKQSRDYNLWSVVSKSDNKFISRGAPW